MKILVTGANGQVGSRVVQLGKKAGFNILAYTKEQLDITNYQNLEFLINQSLPDIIVNAAAYTAVDKAETETETAYAINSDGPSNLANIVSDRNIPLIHLSTDYVYDGKKIDSYTETDIPNPLNIYGKSKLEGDKKVAMLEKHIILRVSWVFDADGNNFVRTMLRLGQERQSLNIVNDQTGSPTWSQDIAEVLIAIIRIYSETNNFPWGLYNFTGKPKSTWYDFAVHILREGKLMGLINKIPKTNPISSEQFPTAANRPKNCVLNCTKIYKSLNISQPDWKIGLNYILKNWKN